MPPGHRHSTWLIHFPRSPAARTTGRYEIHRIPLLECLAAAVNRLIYASDVPGHRRHVAIHLRHVFRHGADLAVHVLDVAGQTGDVIRHQPYLPGHIVHKARHESAPAQCGKCKDPDGRVS